MRHARLWAAVPLLLAAAAPAWAVKEWYDHYRDATERLIRDGKYAEAIKSLNEAVRLRAAPGLDQQTYGLHFVDYLPYYHLGVCHLRTGDFNTAIRMFNIEEDRGAIRKHELYGELRRLRRSAEDAERDAEARRVARLAREEVERLYKEAVELERARKFSDALARLASAQAAAEALDPATQRRIAEARERIRADEKEAAETAARAHRIEQALADGLKLLEAGNATDANMRFDEILKDDPRHAGALAGKREAQEMILASTTRQARLRAKAEGKALLEAGRIDEALRPLTDAAADPDDAEAAGYLKQAQDLHRRMREQKEERLKVERLLAEGERLFRAGKYPEAQVKFEGVLALDPTHLKARSRQGLAQAEAGKTLFGRWLPNERPEFTIFEPKPSASEIEGSTVAVIGVATDDRSIASVEFRIGGQLVAQVPQTRSESGLSARSLPFNRQFPLAPGTNQITVTAFDGEGLSHVQTFSLVRKLRFYETRAFLPAALGGALALIGGGLASQRVRRRRAVRRRFNPYIAGAPVLAEDMFFGRQKLMARMLNMLHHNSLMITGERRIGKTTFLYHLKKALEADEGTDYRFFPVFTDLQGVPESIFFHALMSDIVDSLKLAPATLASLRFRTESEDYDGRDFSHDLQRVIEELKGRTPKKVRLALLIDEVDVLNEYSERVNQRLRSIFMKTFSEHLVAIMSGVGIKRIWKSEVSPWYNFFDEVELSAFTREEAEELIRRPVEGIFKFAPEAVERILAGSQLKPYVIQKFCIHAVNRMLEEGRTSVGAADVEAVREAVLFERREERPAAEIGRQASA